MRLFPGGDIMPVMPPTDSESERMRLADVYSRMSDDELAQLETQQKSLMPIALEALRSEMLKRGRPLVAPPAEPSHAAPVIVRKYRDLPEALIAQNILASEGIDSFLVDENTVRMGLCSSVVGGVKVMVREQDAEIARNLLRQDPPAKFDVVGVGEYEQPHCPQCGSLNVSFQGLNQPASYAPLSLGAPAPTKDEAWICRACDASWEDSSSLPDQTSE